MLKKLLFLFFLYTYFSKSQDNTDAHALNTVTNIKEIHRIITDYLDLYDQLAFELPKNKEQSKVICFSPDSQQMLIADKTGNLRIFDIHTQQYISVCNAQNGPVIDAIYAADGKTIACIYQNKNGMIFNVANSAKISYEKISLIEHKPVAVYFCSEKNCFAFVSYIRNKPIEIIEMRSGKIIQKIDNEEFLGTLTVSHDKKYIASNRERLKIWDLKTGTLKDTLPTTSILLCHFSYTPNGKILATCGSTCHSLYLWHTHNQIPIYKLRNRDKAKAIAYSNHGKYLVSGNENGTMNTYDTQTGNFIHGMQAHTKEIISLVFSPNSTYLASTSVDGTIKLWKRQTI